MKKSNELTCLDCDREVVCDACIINDKHLKSLSEKLTEEEIEWIQTRSMYETHESWIADAIIKLKRTK